MIQTVERQLEGCIRYQHDLEFYLERVGEDPWARNSLNAQIAKREQLSIALEKLKAEFASS